MRSTILVLLLALFASFAFAATVPKADHFIIVAEENHTYASAVNGMPSLMSLVKTHGAIATNFYATTHPSIGNYFSLTTGQIITNNDGSQSTVYVDNLVRHFIQAGVTWKVYAESIPYAGYLGDNQYPYIRHHNPFSYFSDVQSNQRYNIVPFSQFAIDAANDALPEFSFIVPNMYHNAHDGSLSAADSWLKNYVSGPLMQTASFKPGGSGVLAVWFDESWSGDTAHGGGHILVALVGPNVKPGFKDGNFYQHYSLAETVLRSLGLPVTGLSHVSYSSTWSMANSFADASTPAATLAVSAPTDGGTYTSPVTITAIGPSNMTHISVYLDYKLVYGIDAYQINTSVAISSGTHSLIVQGWLPDGTVQKAPTLHITVQ